VVAREGNGGATVDEIYQVEDKIVQENQKGHIPCVAEFQTYLVLSTSEKIIFCTLVNKVCCLLFKTELKVKTT
jgi:hypothetical protein